MLISIKIYTKLNRRLSVGNILILFVKEIGNLTDLKLLTCYLAFEVFSGQFRVIKVMRKNDIYRRSKPWLSTSYFVKKKMQSIPPMTVDSFKYIKF